MPGPRQIKIKLGIDCHPSDLEQPICIGFNAGNERSYLAQFADVSVTGRPVVRYEALKKIHPSDSLATWQ